MNDDVPVFNRSTQCSKPKVARAGMDTLHLIDFVVPSCSSLFVFLFVLFTKLFLMQRSQLFTTLLLLAFACISAPGSESMFDGKSLAGWTRMGNAPVTWSVDEVGQLTFTQDGQGRGWLRWGDQSWSHYRMTLEWKAAKGGNSGVFLHMPEDPESDGTWDGIELQISDDTHYPIFYHKGDARELSGAIYGIVAPDCSPYNGTDQWNHFELTVRANRIKLIYNGQKVLDIDMDDYPEPFEMWKATRKPLSERPRKGGVGIQAHRGGQVWFRNLTFEPLPLAP
jgi:hypothetical protein